MINRSPLRIVYSRHGFTLLELLLSVSIFTLIVAAFVTVLIGVTNVGVQQSSASTVGQESQALLQKMQYYIGTASLINIPTSTPTSTLQLIMASSSASPTYITIATTTGVVYLQQSTSSPLQALSTNKVFVSNLTFTRQSNPPGHDVVNISFTMKANVLNAAQAFSQLFQSSVVHVSAATFDTGVYASGANEPLGTAGLPWTPINGVIYFNGGNVGINAATPGQQLEVNGGVRLNPAGSQPACNNSSNILGTLWFVSGGSGAGALYICNTNASGTYAWHQITTN